MKPHVLVDGDPIVYRIGYASQSRVITNVIEYADGVVEQKRFASKTERNEYLRMHEGSQVVDEQEEVFPEPIENALGGAKRLLGEIADETGSDALHVILSESFGKGNFRHAIARQAVYKGNRKQPRPAHYQNIRDYLVNYHGAQVVETREADDELSIRARRYRDIDIPYVIASIDKDLDQIPGQHYDFAKKVAYTVSDEDARRVFWTQALAGDATDNIPGAWKIGTDTAEKIIRELVDQGVTDRTIFTAIVEQYKKSAKKKGAKYQAEDALNVAIETAQLVYLQQKPCELWSPPGVPFGKIGCEVDD